MRSFISVIVVSLGALLPGLNATAVASPPAAENRKVEVIPIVLHPMPEPKPALKYNLFPTYLDRRPGNAAVHYGKVKSEQNAFFSNRELIDKIEKMQGEPLEKLRKIDRKDPLSNPCPVYRTLRFAARCETCDWDLPIREENAILILLPEMQESRLFARLLASKARLHIARGEFDDAVETLQTGFAQARHVGNTPMLVSALVGTAIQSSMSGQVREFIQQPDAPNLYWALSGLPRPLVDYRRALDEERHMLELTFSELNDLEKRDYTPDQWNHFCWSIINRCVKEADIFGSLVGGDEKCDKLPTHAVLTAHVTLGYPKAKQWLIDHGRKKADVEAMPIGKVVLLYTVELYRELRDEQFKWLYLDNAEGRQGREQAESALLKRFRNREEIIPFAAVFLSGVGNAINADSRGRRDIAVLRVFEAMRIYGYSHNGQLPQKLSDITEVPVPNNPATDKPFDYRIEGSVAILSFDNVLPGDTTTRYEIHFAPKGK
jgi:hypothetical protein